MAIKTSITDKQNTPISYPVLQKTRDGVVVLFTKRTSGVCLHHPHGRINIGTVRNDWVDPEDSNIWSDCTITISND